MEPLEPVLVAWLAVGEPRVVGLLTVVVAVVWWHLDFAARSYRYHKL